MYRQIGLSSTRGGNREMDQLYMTSQVSNSNITRKTSKLNKSVKTENRENKIAPISL